MRGSRPTGNHRLHGSRWRIPVVLATVGSLVLATLTGVAGIATTGLVAAPRASAASVLACDQNTIYGIDASGNMDAINVSTGAASLVKSVSPATNGLGVSSNGVSSYQYNGATRQITKYDPIAGTVTTFSNVDAAAPTTIIRGAINPVNGIYYYAGNGTSAYVGAFNTTRTPRSGRSAPSPACSTSTATSPSARVACCSWCPVTRCCGSTTPPSRPPRATRR